MMYNFTRPNAVIWVARVSFIDIIYCQSGHTFWFQPRLHLGVVIATSGQHVPFPVAWMTTYRPATLTTLNPIIRQCHAQNAKYVCARCGSNFLQQWNDQNRGTTKKIKLRHDIWLDNAVQRQCQCHITLKCNAHCKRMCFFFSWWNGRVYFGVMYRRHNSHHRTTH